MENKSKMKLKAPSKRAIWLSYDLGLRGDYAGLYAWLDTVHARECGDATAFFEVEAPANLEEWLQQELKKHVKLAAKDRVYAIFHEGLKIRGKFLNGGRRRAPWEGYGQQEVTEDTEDAG